MATNTSTRRYDASGRRARSASTRRRIVDAAGELFVERGYAATSIRQIAERAGVAPETIYSGFGSKQALLASWLDRSVVGDDEPVALLDRDWISELATAPTVEERMAILAEHGPATVRRAAPALQVWRAAAQSDPELRTALHEVLQRRHDDIAEMVRMVVRGIELSDDVDHADLVDWMWAVTGDEMWVALIDVRGWSEERYWQWLQRSMLALLRQGG